MKTNPQQEERHPEQLRVSLLKLCGPPINLQHEGGANTALNDKKKALKTAIILSPCIKSSARSNELIPNVHRDNADWHLEAKPKGAETHK